MADAVVVATEEAETVVDGVSIAAVAMANSGEEAEAVAVAMVMANIVDEGVVEVEAEAAATPSLWPSTMSLPSHLWAPAQIDDTVSRTRVDRLRCSVVHDSCSSFTTLRDHSLSTLPQHTRIRARRRIHCRFSFKFRASRQRRT